ncbi:hypothetical protein ACLB1E_21905 [Escherichia coli]
MDYAELRGGSAVDAEAWRDDYEAGNTCSKHIVMSGVSSITRRVGDGTTSTMLSPLCNQNQRKKGFSTL